jgi:hypothetical protein
MKIEKEDPPFTDLLLFCKFGRMRVILHELGKKKNKEDSDQVKEMEAI